MRMTWDSPPLRPRYSWQRQSGNLAQRCGPGIMVPGVGRCHGRTLATRMALGHCPSPARVCSVAPLLTAPCHHRMRTSTTLEHRGNTHAILSQYPQAQECTLQAPPNSRHGQTYATWRDVADIISAPYHYNGVRPSRGTAFTGSPWPLRQTRPQRPQPPAPPRCGLGRRFPSGPGPRPSRPLWGRWSP